jgi:hypothetical protein
MQQIAGVSRQFQLATARRITWEADMAAGLEVGKVAGCSTWRVQVHELRN